MNLKPKLTLAAIMITLMCVGCAWMQGTEITPKKEKITVDSSEAGVKKITFHNAEELYFFVKNDQPSGHPYISVIERNLVDPPINITPNPTSSSITMIFWNNYESLFPQDINVELYYLDLKIQTFEFKQSKGTEVIPDTYLQKEGVYRVAATFSIKVDRGQETYTAPFMVTKGK